MLIAGIAAELKAASALQDAIKVEQAGK